MYDLSVLSKNFKKNHMNTYILKTRTEVIPLLETLLVPGCTIGCGDSVTLEELGVFAFFRRSNYYFLDKYKKDLTKEEKRQIYIRNFSADVFITGTNAVTMDGKLFNIDGNGSRVAPMIYGPQKVIVIVGTNKITSSIDEAIFRARNTAAPLDAGRLGRRTPCSVLNKCIDCSHKERFCNDFVCIAGQFDADRIHLIIVGEKLGY